MTFFTAYKNKTNLFELTGSASKDMVPVFSSNYSYRICFKFF